MHRTAGRSLGWMLCVQGLAFAAMLAPGCKPSSRSGSAAAKPTQPPAAPSALGSAAVSDQQVDLVWLDNSPDEAGFEVERSPDGASFVHIASVAADTPAYPDGDLSEGTTYHYRVRAHGAGGASPYSNTFLVTTDLSAPTNLLAVPVSSQQVDLTWTDNSLIEEEFDIEGSTDGKVFLLIAQVQANVTVFLDPGLPGGTTFFYRVRARNSMGSSFYSNTAGLVPRPIPPVAPSELAATAVSHDRIDLAWKDNSLDETSFEIERATGSGTFFPIAPVAPDTPAYSDGNLSAETTYRYRVHAHGPGGHSGYSNIAEAITPPELPPAAPTGLRAAAVSPDRVDLVWEDNSLNESDFDIERSTDGASFLPLASVAADVTAHSDLTATAGTAYWYRVRARNAAGSSQYSDTASATTPPGPLPRLLRGPFLAEMTTQSIVVAWTTDVPGIGRVEYSLDQSYSSGVTETAAATAHAVTITGLDAGQTYYYQVLTAGRLLASGQTFAAARARDDPRLRFAAIGDSGTGSQNQFRVAAQIGPVDPDLLIHTGDVIYGEGQPENFDPRYFRPYATLIDDIPFFTSLGNHDVETDDGEPYLDAFHLPRNNPQNTEKYYSFDAANVHFTCVDTTQSFELWRAQRVWLEADLGSPEAASADWKFVFMHHPPFSSGQYAPGLDYVREELEQVFFDARVDIVFTGHDHGYERTYPMVNSVPVDVAQNPNYANPGGVIYIVTGGGGGNVDEKTEDLPFSAFYAGVNHLVKVEIAGRSLTLTAIDRDGNEFDRMTLTK